MRLGRACGCGHRSCRCDTEELAVACGNGRGIDGAPESRACGTGREETKMS